MKIRIILDTNCARSEKNFKQLLGNRQELSNLAKMGTLLIPDIVIDELIEQKRSFFENAKDELQRNALLTHLRNETISFDHLNFTQIEHDLRNDKSIPYTRLQLSDKASAFEKICSLATSHTAPFEKSGDKGFKDACIALIVDEYLETLSQGEKVFLLSKDVRLKEYFDNNDSVVPIGSLGDLESRLSMKGQGSKPTPGEIEKDGNNEFIEIKEPTPTEKAKRALLTDFRNSGSFMTTHRLIAKLNDNLELFDTEDFVDILFSACSNNQITWLLQDSDVAQLLNPIFERYGDRLDQDSYERYIRAADIPDKRPKTQRSSYFSENEKRAYRQFADELVSRINSIGSIATINTNPRETLVELKEVLVSSDLEEEPPDSARVLNVFIDGYYTYTSSSFPIGILENFIELLEYSSQAKQETILKNIESRMMAIETDCSDMPF